MGLGGIHTSSAHYRVAENKISIKISGFKGDRFSNLKDCQNLDTFKYSMLFLHYTQMNTDNYYFFVRFITEKFLLVTPKCL